MVPGMLNLVTLTDYGACDVAISYWAWSFVLSPRPRSSQSDVRGGWCLGIPALN